MAFRSILRRKIEADYRAGLIPKTVYDAAMANQTRGPQPQTEHQSKLQLFSGMISGTEPVLQAIEKALSNADYWAMSVGRDGRFSNEMLRGEDSQRYSAASGQWPEGVLRLSTGAAATESEEKRLNAT